MTLQSSRPGFQKTRHPTIDWPNWGIQVSDCLLLSSDAVAELKFSAWGCIDGLIMLDSDTKATGIAFGQRELTIIKRLQIHFYFLTFHGRLQNFVRRLQPAMKPHLQECWCRLPSQVHTFGTFLEVWIQKIVAETGSMMVPPSCKNHWDYLFCSCLVDRCCFNKIRKVIRQGRRFFLGDGGVVFRGSTGRLGVWFGCSGWISQLENSNWCQVGWEEGISPCFFSDPSPKEYLIIDPLKLEALLSKL